MRPTADRVKEALFSILTSRYGSFGSLNVLDLFAGTGNLGIEALSRGAACAVFVDNHPRSGELIRKNLKLTGFSGRAELLLLDVLTALQRLAVEQRRFDLVFIDPPYRELGLMQSVLVQLAEKRLTTDSGLIILECDAKTAPPLPDKLAMLERRNYGDSSILLLEHSG